MTTGTVPLYLTGHMAPVADEIENGLAYFRTTFFTELPRLYDQIETALATEFGLAQRAWLAPFLRVGTWIGGDRDGNPNVTAAVLGDALRAQSRLAFERYLEELQRLSGELSLAVRLSPMPAELLAFAAVPATTRRIARASPTARRWGRFTRGSLPRPRGWPICTWRR